MNESPSAQWLDYVKRAQRNHGDDLDLSNVARQFLPYFQTRQRIKVRFRDGEEMTGRVSITTGWRPALLLIRRSSDLGSPFLLGTEDVVVARQIGRVYAEVVA